MYAYDRVEAVVDLDQIRRNVEEIRKLLEPGTLLCPVIKTDAYGHGMLPVAHEIEDISDYFAVATIDEAVRLRKDGIQLPVFLLGFVPENRFEDLFAYRIYPNVFRLATAEKLSEMAASRGETLPVHLSVDTGMSRLGFMRTEESLKEIEKIASLPGLSLEGLFTHFAAADTKDKTMANEQIRRYEAFRGELEKRGVTFRIYHMAASAGAMECPEAHFDMIRSGIINYGLYPSDEVDQKKLPIAPALSLHSTVIYVKDIEAGDTVSYGATFTAPCQMRIATVPVGYGDGYFRAFSGKGSVLIGGKRAPILGRICMDQFMVDVSHIPGVSEGDEVVLIGRQGEEKITADELAALAGTISYEILCDLGKRIPRTYLKDGKVVHTRDFF